MIFFKPRLGALPVLVFLLLILSMTTAVHATVPLEDSLLAERDCPLYQSIKKGTNPDGVRLVPGQTYPVLGKNKEDASHYRIRADGANPAERWVEVSCGTLIGGSARGMSSASMTGVKDSAEESFGKKPIIERTKGDLPTPQGRFVLAGSWLPAFCELRSRRPECRGAGPGVGKSGVLSFSLHGLWPQPRDAVFCDVSRDRRELAERGPWSLLPALDLGDGTRKRLEAVMPGTLSYLHRYQWIKHGSCYGSDPDAYYRHSVALMDQLNASAVRDLFARNLGRHLSARDIRGAFDQSFGRGAGERVRLRCNDGMISELHIGLRGRVSESASLAKLINAAQSRSVGCRGGRVDAPGIGD